MPRDLQLALSGEGFRRRRRLVLPLITTDPQGFPRVALLTLAEVRANSATGLTVAVLGGSRTAFNLVRRGVATILYLHRQMTASIQARAGRGHVSITDSARRIFPLTIQRVRLDRPAESEGDVSLLTGPTFAGREAQGEIVAAPGFRKAVAADKQFGEVHVNRRHLGAEADRFTHGFFSCREIAGTEKSSAEIVAHFGGFGLDFGGPAQGGDGVRGLSLFLPRFRQGL